VLFAILFILAIVVILVIVLLPFILKLVNYISQNGLQGIIEYILGIVDKIWKGSAQ
jgi:F0F1-type ATP synthase membrane subunit a